MYLFKDNKSEVNVNNQNYDPEHERTCEHCTKKVKTKDGILKNDSFNCSHCYQIVQKEKQKNEIITTIVILGLYLFFIIYLFYHYKTEKKINKRRIKLKGYLDEDDDD